MVPCCAAKSGSSLRLPQDTEGEIEGLVEQLQQGTAEDRGLAAEKLFNKAAEDEQARQRAAAIGVIQPLVGTIAAESSLLEVKGSQGAVRKQQNPQKCHTASSHAIYMCF